MKFERRGFAEPVAVNILQIRVNRHGISRIRLQAGFETHVGRIIRLFFRIRGVRFELGGKVDMLPHVVPFHGIAEPEQHPVFGIILIRTDTIARLRAIHAKMIIRLKFQFIDFFHPQVAGFARHPGLDFERVGGFEGEFRLRHDF